MCGIAGILGPNAKEYKAHTQKMIDALHHRGPDGEGLFVAPSGHCILAQRRLAILDLSDAAAQPMLCAEDRWAFVYNGECYNYLELRSALEKRGESFRSSGDTEVLLRLLSLDGADALGKLNAMFALALWDEKEKTLLLARDRFGQKPLYTVQVEGHLLFASEVRALLASGLVDRKINPAAIYSYLSYGSVQEPDTIVANVSQLPPHSYEIYSLQKAPQQGRFWSPPRDKQPCTPEALRDAFQQAVTRHLISDAPLGLFLSGGVDSSAIAAAAVYARQGPVKTLSMVYPEYPEISEARYANLMAQKLGTEHREIPITGPEMLSALPDILNAMDQPTGDSFNTYMVSLAAHRSGLKVALSGLGGDELFGGYSTFVRAPKMFQLRRWLSPLRPFLSPLLQRTQQFTIKTGKLSELFLQPKEILPSYLISRQVFSTQQIQRIAPSLGQLPLALGLSPTFYQELQSLCPGRAPQDLIGLLELRAYMTQTLLRDSDVMGMRHGLEIRVPFLDNDFTDRVLRLENAARLPYPSGKWRLLEALKDWIPDEIAYRSKQGFTFPFAQWMQKELKAEIESGLQALTDISPSFQRTEIMAMWNKFLKNPQSVGWFRLWILYILGTYLQNNELHL